MASYRPESHHPVQSALAEALAARTAPLGSGPMMRPWPRHRPRPCLLLLVPAALLLLLLLGTSSEGKPVAMASPDQVLENMRQIPQWHCLRYRKFDLVTQHKRCRHFRVDRKH